MDSTCDVPQLIPDAEPAQAKPVGSWRACLVTVGGERFAVDLRQVREVFEPESITPVPGMPPQLTGIANLRGTIIPLVDSRQLLEVSLPTAPKYAIVVQHGHHQVGLLIDDVPEIRTICLDDILTSLPADVQSGRTFVSSLVNLDGRVSGILDIPMLLATVEESAAHGRAPDRHERNDESDEMRHVRSAEEEKSHGEV